MAVGPPFLGLDVNQQAQKTTLPLGWARTTGGGLQEADADSGQWPGLLERNGNFLPNPTFKQFDFKQAIRSLWRSLVLGQFSAGRPTTRKMCLVLPFGNRWVRFLPFDLMTLAACR